MYSSVDCPDSIGWRGIKEAGVPQRPPSFRGLDVADGVSTHGQRVLGFQRRHSLCPVTLPNSKFNGETACSTAPCWGPVLASDRQLPRSSLSHIPFRVDRSISMIEGGVSAREEVTPPLPLPPPPPPGLSISSSSLAAAAAAAAAVASATVATATPPPPPPHISTRYKTELCRTYEESGACKYGAKCQFAHGADELRGLSRHPKYKTEPCRTFHTVGFCPYGARCHFIHNADELRPRPHRPRPPPLRHSLSFAGFSSSPHGFSSSPQGFTPLEEPLFGRACSATPPPSSSSSMSSSSSSSSSPIFPKPGALRPRLFSGTPPDFFPWPGMTAPGMGMAPPPPGGLQRCSSADSLSEEGYASSSCSLSSSSSGADSPGLEGRRLPIFSRLSVSDE
ncbi:unnamed protein product [Menidia menidia]|uniref:mRNA decay activator protein ZFP36 n=1 Tax=Menidia menidia TaxID=238744 RepID=A0A8S4BMA2_9TELE|nr:unnamed protein product [Menidia menidia]